ncbi:biofilm development regulator YmgB/AriR family protein [uncultured Pantoea sp.]|uniref:biofilm development regulator YmgB/AriR family protein n=1 Tax=Pantoea sp. Ep11b TaxID=3141459 RepID=UPI0025E1A864|nr:biofilm development regulator YmgB/AriR family protein [uncultured Pantoea sp.]
MQTTMNTESQISDYFMNSGTALSTEQQVITAVHAELARAKAHVSDKDLVLGLINHLESERDVMKQDIYRQALEHVLQRASVTSDS